MVKARGSDGKGAMSNEVFQDLILPYKSELRVHCYRMTGSVADAGAALGDCFFRAWRGIDAFNERASMRTWLYGIATRACLQLLEDRRRTSVPFVMEDFDDKHAPPPRLLIKPIWLEPCPPSLWRTITRAGGSKYSAEESVSFDFLLAMLRIPPTQRAALLLRDVVGFSVSEIGQILHLSETALTGLLWGPKLSSELSRVALRQAESSMFDAFAVRNVLHRYILAWQASEAAAFLDLLHERATLRIAPTPELYQGKRHAQSYFNLTIKSLGCFAGLATEANGGPAVALYASEDELSPLRFHSLHLLQLSSGRCTVIDVFCGLPNIHDFGCPSMIPRVENSETDAQ